MVDFKKLLNEQAEKIAKNIKEDIMANKANKTNKQTEIVKTRNFERKQTEENSGKGYDFEGAVNIKEFIDQDIEIISGFTKESEVYGTLQATMMIKDENDEVHTVRTNSKILIEQFEVEKAAGLPVRARVVEISSKKSEYKYLSFVPAETD